MSKPKCKSGPMSEEITGEVLASFSVGLEYQGVQFTQIDALNNNSETEQWDEMGTYKLVKVDD